MHPRPVVQELVEIIGDVFVVEGDGVGVVPKRRHRITVPEPGLGLEQLPVADEMGGHCVAEAVQRRTFDAGSDPEAAELVRQAIGGKESRPGRRG